MLCMAEVCSCKTISFALFFKRFHSLIVLSSEPEATYLLSFITTKAVTKVVCPSKQLSCCLSTRFHILIDLSSEPEII